MKTLKVHDRIRGCMPGTPCPHCRCALLPVLSVEEGEGGVIGGRRSLPRRTIDHLACEGCSTSYEVAMEFRERDLRAYLEDQVVSSTNPESKPAECPHCREELTFSSKVEDYTHGRRRGPVAKVADFLYCDICFKVYWVEKPIQPSVHHNPV
ncbi:MAG: hypothetical protein RDU25_02190 [Patescibacteria group bacterium]|nr:hypothetical protein [Patescibacteria group bacterium]